MLYAHSSCGCQSMRCVCVCYRLLRLTRSCGSIIGWSWTSRYQRSFFNTDYYKDRAAVCIPAPQPNWIPRFLWTPCGVEWIYRGIMWQWSCCLMYCVQWEMLIYSHQGTYIPCRYRLQNELQISTFHHTVHTFRQIRMQLPYYRQEGRIICFPNCELI